MNIHRVLALLLKHGFLMRRSVTRAMEILYWPVLDLLVWGYVSVYLMHQMGGGPNIVAYFLGGLIFWEVLFRSQQAITISFLEDVWARNLLNLFVSPLTPAEFILSTILLGVVKTAIGAAVMGLLAWMLYSFNIFTVGPALIAYFAGLLLLGWAVGIVTTALILRFGQSAEILAWGLAFLLQPFVCVFYPLSALPTVLQKIAWWIPATHVFEGMRVSLSGGALDPVRLAWAYGLDLIYLAAAGFLFHAMFEQARARGLLMKLEF